MSGHTIYTTYFFKSNDYDQTNSFGYKDTIHCGYINNIFINTLTNTKITLYFNNINDFPFLNGGIDYSGWTANKFFALIQIIDNTNFTDQSQIKPLSNEWRIIELTSQASDGIRRLTPNDMIDNNFIIDLSLYNTAEIYNLDYLNYPTLASTNTNNLSFGDEQVLIGNVSTDIEAIAKVCDIPIILSYDDFNISTNKTWTEGQDVYISEVGIYSSAGDLVAIGKFNTPVQKNSLISRTIKFELDF